jgi:hypothetical protein
MMTLAPNLSRSRPARAARQCSDLCANLTFGKTQLIELLQVHPELWTVAKPVRKPQRCVGCDASLAMNNARDTVHRYIDLTRKFGGRNAKLAHFFGKVFAGVDGGTRHDGIPSMVIDDLDVNRAWRSVRRCEANPPLIVDSNRKLSGAIASEYFQPIARQCRQVSQARRGIQPIKTHLGLPCEAGVLLDMLSGSKPLGASVAVADNHNPAATVIYDLRKQ